MIRRSSNIIDSVNVGRFVFRESTINSIFQKCDIFVTFVKYDIRVCVICTLLDSYNVHFLREDLEWVK